MLTFSIIGRVLLIILRYVHLCMHIAIYWRLLSLHDEITYYLYLSPFTCMYYPETVNPTTRTERERGQQDKPRNTLNGYPELITKCEYSNCVRESISRGRRQGWLSTIPATCHKLSHWPYMALAADSIPRYFRTPQSEPWCWNNIDIWYARNRTETWRDRSLIWIGYLRPFTLTHENWETRQSLCWVEFILYAHVCALRIARELYQVTERYVFLVY